MGTAETAVGSDWAALDGVISLSVGPEVIWPIWGAGGVHNTYIGPWSAIYKIGGARDRSRSWFCRPLWLRCLEKTAFPRGAGSTTPRARRRALRLPLLHCVGGRSQRCCPAYHPPLTPHAQASWHKESSKLHDNSWENTLTSPEL